MKKEVEQIPERDWKMARVMYEEQFLSIDTISSFFFNGIKTNAYRRLRILFKQKLIRFEMIGITRLMRVVRLTQKGIDLYREKFPVPVKQKRKLPSATLIHDQYVIETRLYLSNISKASWVPERLLKSLNLEKIPDGILTISEKQKIAVEVENSTKSKVRYEAIWREWESQNFLIILYVSTNEAVHRALVKNMKEFQSNSVCLGLIRFSDLSNSELKSVWTPRGDVALFSKRDS